MRKTGLVLAALLAMGCGRTAPLFDYQDFEDAFPQLDDPIVDGCNKVDYLFVIDNSASMAPYQERLVENFGTFVEGVQRSQDSLDSVHVGVLTTDAYIGNASECNSLGDLVTRTGGYNSSASECGPFDAGQRYMTEEDDLAAAFEGTAKVGTEGSDSEQPLAVIDHALREHKLAEGGCNEGFLRDDALLVLVVVTDEDDPSPMDFAYDRVVEAKQGWDDNVVVVTLTVNQGGPCSTGGHSGYSYQVNSFADAFEHSFVGSICADDYAPTFQSAVDVVQNACG